LTPWPQHIASVAAGGAVDIARSSEIGTLWRGGRLARSAPSKWLNPGVGDQVLRRVDAFRKVPNLLKERELILPRRDFYHLAVFEATDGEVSHLYRLAGSLDAPV
jgi:hypothetical protein